MNEKRFVAEQVDVVNEDETEVWDIVFDTENTYVFMVRDTDSASDLCDLLNEQQATIEHLTKSRDKWSKSAKLHSEYFNCLEKAIERAYEEKPYPKIEDIMNIYSKLEKEIDDE